jgi:hypothetical protein
MYANIPKMDTTDIITNILKINSSVHNNNINKIKKHPASQKKNAPIRAHKKENTETH